MPVLISSQYHSQMKPSQGVILIIPFISLQIDPILIWLLDTFTSAWNQVSLDLRLAL